MMVGDRSWSYLFALQIASEIKLVQILKLVIEGDQLYASERWLKLRADWLTGLSYYGEQSYQVMITFENRLVRLD